MAYLRSALFHKRNQMAIGIRLLRTYTDAGDEFNPFLAQQVDPPLDECLSSFMFGIPYANRPPIRSARS